MAFPRQRDVVQVTQDDHPALPSHLENELLQEIQNQMEGLLSAKDWPDFEKRRGLINGLKLSISFCQDINKKLNA